MSPVQSFLQRYEAVVSSTLETLSSPSQMISFGVNTSLADVRCHTDDDYVHQMPAVSVFWTVQEGEIYDVAYFQLVLVPEPVEEDEMADKVVEAWEEMIFARQVSSMSELDDEMDALADGESPG